MGVISIYHGYHLLCELGFWLRGSNERVEECVTLSGTALLFLAVYLIGRWGVEHRVATTQVRVLEEGVSAPTAPSVDKNNNHALLAAVLNTLPFSITIINKRGKVLYRNEPQLSPFSAPVALRESWSATVNHVGIGCQLQLEPIAAQQRTAEPQVAADSAGFALVNSFTSEAYRNLDRRRTLRLPMGQPVRVELLDGSLPAVSGEMIDFSGAGLGLLLTAAFPVGSTVLVRVAEHLIIAQVMNCQQDADGFRLGLEITDFFAARVPAGTSEESLVNKESSNSSSSAWLAPAQPTGSRMSWQFGRAE